MAQYGQTGYGSGPNMSDMTVGDYANGMPNIRIGEMLKSMMRQMFWIIPLLLLGMVPAWYFTKDIKRTYEGTGKIYVQQGIEHTYDPITGERGQGIIQGPEAITATEIAIMRNNEVIERVIGEMVSKYGETRFNKVAFSKINAARRSGDQVALANARVDLYKSVEDSFWVTPVTKSTVFNLGFKHTDGEIAVDTLNALIDAYISLRRTIFIDGAPDVYGARREATETQLNEVERNIQSFLRRNGLSDFDSERTGATERTENLRAELNTIRSQTSESEAALATVETQLRATPQEINLYTDDRAMQRVAQAELELKQLLAKYLPGSDPVRAKQAEIAELKSLQTANGGQAIGGRRVGVNPTFQTLMAERNRLQALADSYREKEFTVQQLLNAADSKVRKLQRLSPEYNNLLRERDTLDQRLTGYTNKLQEALVNQEQNEANSENVKVIDYATLPRKGRNMKKILFALAMVGWLFTLIMVALLKVFLDPKLYSDPTRRMRPKPQPSFADDEFETEEFGRGVPSRAAPQPFVPEPVPMQPAAAQEQNPFAAQPYNPDPSQPYPEQNPMPIPYVGAGGVAYDMNAQVGQAPSPNNPYVQGQPQPQPQAQPQPHPQAQAFPVSPGPLPTSEDS